MPTRPANGARTCFLAIWGLEGRDVGVGLIELRNRAVGLGLADGVLGQQVGGAVALQAGQGGAGLGGHELGSLDRRVDFDEQVARLHRGAAVRRNADDRAIGVRADGHTLNRSKRADRADRRAPFDFHGFNGRDGTGRHDVRSGHHLVDLGDLDGAKRQDNDDESADGDEEFLEHGGKRWW
jgi:hypothetical protein